MHSQELGTRTLNSKEIVEISINKVTAGYSTEEPAFFRAALDRGHISQTSSTDPGASSCDGCPLCHKINKWANLSRRVELHCTMSHREVDALYHITVNDKPEIK